MPGIEVTVHVKDSKGVTTKTTLLADKDTKNCFRFTQGRTEGSSLFGSIYVIKGKTKATK